MENLSTFALMTALLALFFLGLGANVVRLRIRYRVALGSDGHEDLQRAIRVHGNLAEYAPFAMMLLLILAFMDINTIYYALLCFAFCVGRVAHVYGILIREQINPHYIRFRQLGLQLSFAVIGLSALTVLFIVVA